VFKECGLCLNSSSDHHTPSCKRHSIYISKVLLTYKLGIPLRRGHSHHDSEENTPFDAIPMARNGALVRLLFSFLKHRLIWVLQLVNYVKLSAPRKPLPLKAKLERMVLDEQLNMVRRSRIVLLHALISKIDIDMTKVWRDRTMERIRRQLKHHLLF
jgi:hypothetical protein